VAAIAAGVAVFNAVAGSLPAGKALPVAKARLKVGDVLDESKPVGPQDKEGVYGVSYGGGMPSTPFAGHAFAPAPNMPTPAAAWACHPARGSIPRN
jgi:hypothetical protein